MSMFTPVELRLLEASYQGVKGVTCLDQGNPGPHVAIFAVTHGNEISGFDALVHLMEEQRLPEREIKGKIFLIVHNIEAYRRYREAAEQRTIDDGEFRYLDKNLNRVYDAKLLEDIASVGAYEIRRAQEIAGIIPELDYVLDLHSTSRPSDPMLIGGAQTEDIAVSDKLFFYRHVLDIFDKIPGETLLGYVKKHGRQKEKTVAIAVECGSHFQSNSRYCARKTALRFLHAAGSVNFADLPGPKNFQVTKYKVVKNLLPQCSDFHWSKPWTGFQSLLKGTVLATENHKPIILDDDYVLIMPTAVPKVGEEGVYLSKVLG